MRCRKQDPLKYALEYRSRQNGPQVSLVVGRPIVKLLCSHRYTLGLRRSEY